MRKHNLLKLTTASLLGCWITSSLGQSGSLQVGTGYSSDNSYRFGQFSGITGSGGFGVAGFDLQSSPESADADAGTWQLSGQDIGLETVSLAASYNRLGNYSLQLQFDQLPRYRFNDGLTPFNGSGTSRQSLPGNWQGAGTVSGFTTLEENLKQVNIDTRRERYLGGFDWQLSPALKLTGEFSHETKEGNETLGAIFGSTGGNPRGAMVARPVDYQTDEATLALSFGGQGSQYNVSYTAMLFSNKDKDLRFDNPFNNAEWAAGAGFQDGAVGQIGLEPDNKSHQWAISGAQALGGTARLSGSLVSNRLEQNDSFLPYSNVLEAEYPLPARDLDGRIDSLTGNLNFSTRLGRQLSLRLRYNYRDRDNQTPRNNYQRIPGDAELQHPLISETTRVNRIYDLERHRYNAELTYRISGRNRLSGGLERENTDRSMVDVATTDETTGFLKLDFAPSTVSSGWLKLTRSRRDASTYDSTVPFVTGHNPDYVASLMGNELFENDPLLRRYHLTDRDRDEVSGNLNFYPNDYVGISVLGKYYADDYPDALVGLTESTNSNFAVDLSLSPAADWKASLYYNLDRFDNENRGYTRLGFPFNTPFFPRSVRNESLNWQVGTRDRVHSLGGGLDWDLIQGRLQLSLDAAWTDATTETNPDSGNGFLPIPGVTADEPFPDVTTEIASLSFRGNYVLRPGRELSLRYYYENYNSTDWALDRIRVDSVANMLLTGTRSFDYSAHLVILSLLISLD